MGFAIGDRVGPYEIIQCIGQGGMATIYKARQVALDRYVALKVIHPALRDDPTFLTRLSREATIVGRLNHPNIIPVYDFGESGGVPYLVMRYIDGKSLRTILQETRLDTAYILAITRSIASALQYAHEHGVLHRDVKPSNVLLDSEGNVYLTDFGLARLLHSGQTTMSRSMLIGSPLYISPEQARGEAVDERSDIYSLGVVLYEMFTGIVPFTADTTYATIMAQINNAPPPPRSIDPSISSSVEEVLLKALAKRRQDRYASPIELVSALERAVSNSSEQYSFDAPVGRSPRARAGARKRVKAPTTYSRELSCLRTLILILAFIVALYLAFACVLVVGLQTPWQELVPLFSSISGP